MNNSGLLQVNTAKANGPWDNAYTASEMEAPKDFISALNHEPAAKAFFTTLTKSSRYIIAHGLLSAKKPETRQRRFSKYLELLTQEKKP